MGYSIPAAIGAKMASPDKTVVAVMGDGAFQMSMMELATMKQNDIDLKLVVIKNGVLGMVREYQHYNCMDRFDCVELCDEPYLDKLSAAYSIPYFHIQTNSDIKRVLTRFLAKDGSALLQVDVDPRDLAKY